MKLVAMLLLVALLPLMTAAAQGTAPVITLQQSIDSALSKGDENKVLQGGLEVVRAQHALNVSRNSFSLTGIAGYNVATPYGVSVSNVPIASAATPSPLGGLAGVSLGGPLTSVSLNTYPWIPPTGSNTDNSSSVGLTLTQTLWNGYPGGTAQATVDKSLLSLKGKELSTDAGRLGIIYNVKQAYYTMLAAQRNSAIKRQILDKQNAVLKQIQSIYDLKLASLVDLRTAQVNARSAQVDVDSAAHDLRFAAVALATLMGLDPSTPLAVADTDDPMVPAATVEEAVSQGLKRRVEIKQLDLSLQSSNIDLALARGQGTPTISVSGGANVLLDWKGTPGGTMNAGVKVSMPVLDAGAVSNQVSAIQRQNEVYAVQESQQRKIITTAIQTAWDNLQLAREKLDLAKFSADTTALQFQITSAARDAGTASNQDMLTASVNDATAQTALATAKSAAQLAALQLLNVMGY